MTDDAANLAELCELSNALGSEEKSPWQPRCIASAFATPLPRTRHLTMQAWIDLDAIRSPFLLGIVPEDAEAFLAAASALHLVVTEHTPPLDIAVLQEVIFGAVDRAFATALPMRSPKGGEKRSDAGFGGWLPLYACLVAEIGLDPDKALEMRVDRALALIAGLRHNQGLEVAGVPYALRDQAAPEAEEEERTDG